MKITTLIENTCSHEGCKASHGLSFFIETDRHKLLFDTGPSAAFVKNAELLGVDLKEAEMAVISHGHYDHAGGVLAFAAINPTAKIIFQSGFEAAHFNGDDNIGINPDILKLPELCVISGDKKIDDELYILAGITGRRLFPKGNLTMRMEKEGALIQDDFAHEQHLVIFEKGKSVLHCGCAHTGIVNILDKYKEVFGGYPDVVIGGFHMMKKTGPYTQDEEAFIEDVAKELLKTGALFYTGHCTSEPAVRIMEKIMGEQVRELSTGLVIEI